MARFATVVASVAFALCALTAVGARTGMDRPEQVSIGQAPSPAGSQAPESMVNAAAGLAKSGSLRAMPNGDLVFDRALLVEGTTVSEVPSQQLDAFFTKVQVGRAPTGSPVFVEVGVDKSSTLSSATLDAIAAIIDQGRPDVQACAGGRECVRMCNRDGREQCCEWRCQK